tara:strand:- start:7550 stop:8410 length:861 start_codon:yes stop_codon:yes gene_type:complete
MIIWLASYPKSGNTWVRFFIISLLMGKKVDLNLNHLKAISSFPDKIHFKGLLKDVLDIDEIAKNWISSQKRINSDKNFKFFKTHNMFIKYKDSIFTDIQNTLGTIHIVRDPRNVITSIKNHYSFSNYQDAKGFLFRDNQILTPSEKEKEMYLNKDRHPLPTIIGSWKTHYLSWRNMKKNNLLIKYEDLIKKPKEEFTKISNFLTEILKVKFNEDQIDTAIHLSSFNNLQGMEKKHGFTESTTNTEGKKNKFFYLGPENNWHKILDRNYSDEISKRYEKEMTELGYL